MEERCGVMRRGRLPVCGGVAGPAPLPIIERVLGPEQPDTLTTRGNLAYWTREAGDDVVTGEH